MSSESESSAWRIVNTDEEIVVERRFHVDGTPAEAWSKLVQLSAAHECRPATWWLPGFECFCTEVEAVEDRRLEVLKAQMPCKDTTIVMTFEHAETGTRINVTQSGFDPAFVEMAGENFWKHGKYLLEEVERFFRGDVELATN